MLIATLVISWNCSDRNINTIEGNEINQTDGTVTHASMIIYEKVGIYPLDGEYYETYLELGVFSCQNIFEGAGNLCTNYLTTPPAYRETDEGEVVNLGYKVERGYRFLCATGNCNVVWEIGSSFVHNNSVQSLGSICGSETGCTPSTYCGTNTIITEPVSLQPNTQYLLRYGGIKLAR
jgi:hypothetical protein